MVFFYQPDSAIILFRWDKPKPRKKEFESDYIQELYDQVMDRPNNPHPQVKAELRRIINGTYNKQTKEEARRVLDLLM